jgi:peptide/nickel transport system permease protein
MKSIPLSPGGKVLRRLTRDPFAVISFIVTAAYILLAAAVASGVIVLDITTSTGDSYMPPSLQNIFGTDIFGRDVFMRVLYGAKIAVSVGFVTTAIALPIGIFLGSIAGYFGGRTDSVIVWFYSTLSSIPYLLLLLALAFILGKGIFAIYIALGLTSWVEICRVTRGEIIKLRDRDYVSAAKACGAGTFRILFRHLLPNVLPVLSVSASLLFVAAIKAEVILSFLGVGVQGEPSWGLMIADSRLELLGRGVWWQLTGATVAMFGIILALNTLADSLRDALDPKGQSR